MCLPFSVVKTGIYELYLLKVDQLSLKNKKMCRKLHLMLTLIDPCRNGFENMHVVCLVPVCLS